jgi:hypothetical protein
MNKLNGIIEELKAIESLLGGISYKEILTGEGISEDKISQIQEITKNYIKQLQDILDNKT